MSMCKGIENVCDYDAYVFCSLPSVLFARLLLLFLLLIWHHERGLGLLTGITDSVFFFFFELVIYKHYGLSRFFVYICIALTSFCRTALGRSTKLSVFSLVLFPLFQALCVLMNDKVLCIKSTCYVMEELLCLLVFCFSSMIPLLHTNG